jgi:molybdopterin converting factor small subunit
MQMPVIVRFPEALQRLTGGEDEVTANGRTIAELFDDLEARFAGVRQWACDDADALRPYVSLFVNRQEVGPADGLDARVAAGDTVSIIPCVRGGAAKKRRIYLTFPQELIREPIIFRIGHEFNIVTNIRGASVSDEVGLVALEIEGEPPELERAIEWLKKKGIKIEPLDEEVK